MIHLMAVSGITMITRTKCLSYLETLLEPSRFQDYCPNGLQVEGKEKIDTLITGVTASQDLIDAAIDMRADAVIVHHGFFWRGEDPRVKRGGREGPEQERLYETSSSRV